MYMYNRNEGKALAIPLVEFGNNNCSARNSVQKHDTVTAAKCLNSEVFEGYTFNGLKFAPNLCEFLLFN